MRRCPGGFLYGEPDPDRPIPSLEMEITEAVFGELPEGAGLCDADGDGVCNTTDARLVQRWVVGQLGKDALSCAEDPIDP